MDIKTYGEGLESGITTDIEYKILAKILSVEKSVKTMEIEIQYEDSWKYILTPNVLGRMPEFLRCMGVCSLSSMIGKIIWVYGTENSSELIMTGISLLKLDDDFFGVFNWEK